MSLDDYLLSRLPPGVLCLDVPNDGEEKEKMKMRKYQAEKEFKEQVLPRVKERYEQDGEPDYPARREAWNNWVDSLIKDGVLPEQAGGWAHPAVCTRKKKRK